MMTFQQALDYLMARLPMYQRVGKVAYKKDLRNTLALLEALKNPHQRLKTVHIAGTNGKGTSAHALAAILQESGYRTGLYTSPHLKSFTERIKINGREVAQDWVARFTEKNQGLFEQVQPSFFEATVAMAFAYFEEQAVDVAVIETGLGGRLDSTNVITPEVCLITNIGFDHMDLLGDTIPQIAFEKAGIIKPGVPVVIGDMVAEAVEVMREAADERLSPLILTAPTSGDWDLSRTPPYFSRNLPGVLGVVDQLNRLGWSLPADAVRKGIEDFIAITDMKGRFQRVSDQPLVIADVSHNPDGMRILFRHIAEGTSYGQMHIVFGTVKDKDLKPVFAELPPEATYYFTQSHVPRSLSAQELARQAKFAGLEGVVFENVNDAKKAALDQAASDDLVLVTGSTFVVAELDDIT